MNESDESKLTLNVVGACAFLLVLSVCSMGAYSMGKNVATKEVESRIDSEHQHAIEDSIVCKLSLALTQQRLQRFEQVESEQLQSCCSEE
jgi:hypothetical protein